MTHRLSSCAAAAHVLNGRTKSAVRRRYQRQRRRSRDDPFNESKKKILCKRAVKSNIFTQRIARPEVKEPEVPSGAFAYFCHCWERSERCLWQMKRGERVAAVKISAA